MDETPTPAPEWCDNVPLCSVDCPTFVKAAETWESQCVLRHRPYAAGACEPAVQQLMRRVDAPGPDTREVSGADGSAEYAGVGIRIWDVLECRVVGRQPLIPGGLYCVQVRVGGLWASAVNLPVEPAAVETRWVPGPDTREVHIAVLVDADGGYVAEGWGEADCPCDRDAVERELRDWSSDRASRMRPPRLSWVVAHVPLPEAPAEVPGVVAEPS